MATPRSSWAPSRDSPWLTRWRTRTAWTRRSSRTSWSRASRRPCTSSHPRSARSAPSISGELPRCLQFAAAHYRYTFLDVPRSEAAALDALEGVASILIVANQELATVRNAGRIAATLRQRYGKERVKIVISRFDKQAEIGTEDVERVVGSPVKYTIPSDYRPALNALNKGRPIALDKDNKLTPAFQAMAFDLAGIRRRK